MTVSFQAQRMTWVVGDEQDPCMLTNEGKGAMEGHGDEIRFIQTVQIQDSDNQQRSQLKSRVDSGSTASLQRHQA